MKRHWKKIAGAVVVLIVLVLGASFLYTNVFHKARHEFVQSDVDAKLDAAVTTAATSDVEVLATTVASGAATAETSTTGQSTTGQSTTAQPTTTQSTIAAGQAATTGIDGTWAINAGSEVGYRVKESINGFGTTADGRTQTITGSMVATGTTITEGQFTVDMTTFTSDESRRDQQFNGRVMDVSKYPTSTFVLTAPIDFGAIPSEGGTVTASATGDLTLHGTTKSVTFDVQGTFKNGLIGVLGEIPVIFADYHIPAPSIGTVSTEDNGLLEFVLVLERN
jgi:polyisoprenoid-binding protein YceI